VAGEASEVRLDRLDLALVGLTIASGLEGDEFA